ncbi:nucleoside diphosphate kinase-like [Ornithodoros turicata]|uniref:nucleoside diphosphate kinase-like n=1 Tax=Ornithodoros turicata TaxID=34597 RepID=UPI0031396FE1
MVVGLLMSLYAALSPAVRALRQRTFILVKPEAVQRGILGKIVSRFEKIGYKLVGMKFCQPSDDVLQKALADITPKTSQSSLGTGPVVVMVWEGRDVVQRARAVIGADEFVKCTPGSIRGDSVVNDKRNVVYGSDSAATAEKEISLWFQRGEIVQWDCCLDEWISRANS